VRERLYAPGAVRAFLELEDVAAPRPAWGRIARDVARLSPPAHRADALEDLAAATWEDGDEGPFVRAINFHTTPPRRTAEVARELEAAAAAYVALDEAAVRARIAGDNTPPGVLPVFFEGWRSQYDHALPLLERSGLVGWFVVPTALIDTPPGQQLAMAEAHDLVDAEDEHGDGRVAMTWDELRDVADRGHVVTCHTATHAAAEHVTDAASARRELHDARARLEEQLGRPVRTLTWLYGAAFGEHPYADEQTVAAGYELVLSSTKLQLLPR
jgi:peptidoglycan/xylan/chitin deacetylase (PgdA/CDA1 family)